MVHSFFRKIALHPGIANFHARIGSDAHFHINLWFSNAFPIFFPDEGDFDEKVESWLDIYSKGFDFNELPGNGTNPQMIQQVKILFRRMNLKPGSPHNIRVFKFWLFLVWIYKQLLNANYNRNDNLFEFMRGLSIEDTRVVIVGNEPAKDVPSSGYAFHLSQSPSTRQMLDFLGEEMFEVSEYLENYSLAISSRELNGAKGNCNLGEWIQQGVRLLNSRLTNGEGPIYQGWQILTDFIIRYIGDNVGNVAFIFLGGAVSNKVNLVNRSNNNFVTELYHPARYTYSPPRPVKQALDWKTLLPFLNANFYLYQINRENDLIDWKSIGWQRAGKKRRLRHLTAFFAYVMWEAAYCNQGMNAFLLKNIFVVKRGRDNILSLHLITKFFQLLLL